MLQWIWWFLNGLKVVGIKEGQRPKNSAFLFLVRFWKYFFHLNHYNNLCDNISNRFLKSLMVSELLGAKGAKTASFKEFVEILFFIRFEWSFFQNVDLFNSLHRYVNRFELPVTVLKI